MMYYFDKAKGQRARDKQRGFTLLIAVIFSAVVLSVGLALLDISFKQITLASTARQSEYSFYNADSALECALYMDSIDEFDYSSEPSSGNLPGTCDGQSSVPFTVTAGSGSRTTTWTVPCAGDSNSGDGSADVTIIKESTGHTYFYANGYNTCNSSNPQRVERGEEAYY